MKLDFGAFEVINENLLQQTIGAAILPVGRPAEPGGAVTLRRPAQELQGRDGYHLRLAQARRLINLVPFGGVARGHIDQLAAAVEAEMRRVV